VRFPDGRLRIVRVGVADSFATCPAKPSRGRIGHIHIDGESGELRFVPCGDAPQKESK
jgi:hypothetical protein